MFFLIVSVSACPSLLTLFLLTVIVAVVVVVVGGEGSLVVTLQVVLGGTTRVVPSYAQAVVLALTPDPV